MLYSSVSVSHPKPPCRQYHEKTGVHKHTSNPFFEFILKICYSKTFHNSIINSHFKTMKGMRQSKGQNGTELAYEPDPYTIEAVAFCFAFIEQVVLLAAHYQNRWQQKEKDSQKVEITDF